LVRLIAAETRRIDPVSCAAIQSDALRMRVYRLLNRWEKSWRRSTHKAQNTRLSDHVIVDFQEMVKEKIEMLGVLPSNVYNVDQTNIYYSMESSYTLAPKGSRAVTVKGANSNKHCSVILGAS
jgi:hypothetical protein